MMFTILSLMMRITPSHYNGLLALVAMSPILINRDYVIFLHDLSITNNPESTNGKSFGACLQPARLFDG
jgi:hypothetical protein